MNIIWAEEMNIIWAEDECTMNLEGHETIYMAWERLYKTDFKKLWDSVKDTEIDGGDFFSRVMPNGVMVGYSYDGYCIFTK